MAKQWHLIMTLAWIYFQSLCFDIKNPSCYTERILNCFEFEIESIKFKLLQAVATRMRFRMIIKWYAHGMLIFVCGFCIVVSATILK